MMILQWLINQILCAYLRCHGGGRGDMANKDGKNAVSHLTQGILCYNIKARYFYGYYFWLCWIGGNLKKKHDWRSFYFFNRIFLHLTSPHLRNYKILHITREISHVMWCYFCSLPKKESRNFLEKKQKTTAERNFITHNCQKDEKSCCGNYTAHLF